MAGSSYEVYIKNLVKKYNLQKKILFSDALYGDSKWGSILASRGMILASHGENFGISVVESLSLGKPVLVMRETTERPEAIDAGTVKLVGTDRVKIIEETEKILNDDSVYDQMSKAHNPYGDGLASQRIADVLKKELL